MKYLFIALVYFSIGFVFPTFSTLATCLVGLVMLLLTVTVVFNLYDDQLEMAGE